MAIAKITEITSGSTVSFDDAIKDGIARAAKTIRGVEGAWVKDQKLVVVNGKITEDRVNLKFTFMLD
jgi:flavin-binding protein dodecin